jgi:hypothetical protein
MLSSSTSSYIKNLNLSAGSHLFAVGGGVLSVNAGDWDRAHVGQAATYLANIFSLNLWMLYDYDVVLCCTYVIYVYIYIYYTHIDFFYWTSFNMMIIITWACQNVGYQGCFCFLLKAIYWEYISDLRQNHRPSTWLNHLQYLKPC